MVSLKTPTLTLKLYKTSLANQSSISPQSVTFESPPICQVVIVRETRRSGYKPTLTTPFYPTINQRSVEVEDSIESPLIGEPETA